MLTVGDVDPVLRCWSETRGGRLEPVNHSENHVFLVESPTQARFMLRIHRQGYQSRQAIQSELAWLAALQHDTDLPIARPIIGINGEALQGFGIGNVNFLAVLFQYLPGVEPRPEADLTDLFVRLGGYAAQLHTHAISWKRPEWFVRSTWCADTILNEDGLWGDWRLAHGVDGDVRAVLDSMSDMLRCRLSDYGTAPRRYGLIHGDLRLGNVLIDGDAVSIIDFDDMGFGWFAYDFAAAISFHEARPEIPALRTAWLRGYQVQRQLDAEDIAILESMVMLRRMALLAWLNSHGRTKLAQQHMPCYVQDTVVLAQRYLAGAIWT